MAVNFNFFKASAKNQQYGGELSLKENLEALRFIPPFLKLIWRTQPWMAGSNLILRLIQAGVPLATLFVGKLIIDEIVLLANAESGSIAVDSSYIWSLVGVEFGLVLLTAILSRGITLLDALLGDLFSNTSSEQLIAHAASLDLSQFEDAQFYDKLERARRQTTGRVALMSQIFSQLQDLITIIFLAGGLIVFNPWLILLLIIAVIPGFISETFFNQKSYSLARNWTPQRRELDYLRYIGASDQSAKEVKIFGLSDFLIDKFSQLAHTYYEANKKLAIQRAGWGLFFNSLGDIGYYIAYIIIIQQTITGQISLGDLTFLTGSFSRMRGSMQRVLSRFSSIAQSALYLQDFFDFLALRPNITNPLNPVAFPKVISKGFIFDKVSFKYPYSERYAVKDISFHFHAGEKLALVGENGAGKTTLVKLLARLYDPTSGKIYLDGRSLNEYDLVELRKAIGVIFQDYVRFQMTVSDNISVGKIDERTNQGLIIHAAEKSLADTVVEKLPDQYEQMLGRRFQGGVELSGGEWQKVALGRAYMREAKVLILDEPTAALDARAEYEVFERFTDLTKGKMAVLISHRFSTVRMADRILVLKKGELHELGTHDELLAQEGLYAELFLLQAKGYQ